MKDTGLRIKTGESTTTVAIKVEHVSKTFRLPHNRQNSLKGSLINIVKGGDRTYEKQEVLRDVSFEIKKGEFFGIVGRNGSGKSTLLKMLAGIYKPSSGKITVNGSLTPFIELGVGFNQELTGRENVYLNGALLGFSRQEIETMYDDIVAFAELERFMDQKLKNYSSGMQVRLAFSIAIRARSNILLLDEVLAVGDEAFQRKCFDYFEELKKNKQTVVLVTHDMGAVERFCTKAMFINDGNIVSIANPIKIAAMYSAQNELAIDAAKTAYKQTREIKIKLSNSTGQEQHKYGWNDALRVNIEWVTLGVSNLGIAIYSADGVYVYGASTPTNGNDATLDIRLNLTQGTYNVAAFLFAADGKRIGIEDQGPHFEVVTKQNWGGLTKLESEWRQ